MAKPSPFYAKTTEGWKQGYPYVKTATGWKRGMAVYKKTGTSTWTRIWEWDTTPTAAPKKLTLDYLPTPNKKLLIETIAPGDADVKYLRIKVSSASYPVSSTHADATYFADVQKDGSKWSDVPVTPNQTVNRLYPPSGAVVAGKTYYVSVWAIDDDGNVSEKIINNIKVTTPTAPTAARVVRSAYINVVDSASVNSNGKWYPDHLVRQGFTPDYMGLWFYSNNLTNVFGSEAKRKGAHIIEVKLTVTRFADSYGAPEGTVRLFGHVYANHNLLARPGFLGGADTPLVFPIARGETKTVKIPSTWYDDIKTGTLKGFGIDHSAENNYSANSLALYGKGTISGRIYIEWLE